MASSFRTVGYYGSHALCLGSSIAAKSAVDYLTSPPMHNENPWFTVCKFAINNLGLKQIAGPYLDQRIKKSVDALTPDSLKTGDAKLMAELEKRARSLKEEYLKIKDDPRVFEENRSYLKAYIEKSEKSLEYLKGNRAFDPSIPSRLDEISAFLDAIQKTLSFPKEVKRIDFKTSEEEIKSLTTNVDRNLGVQIQRIGKSIALASQNTDHSMNSKKIYYLKGHPGTGKTFLANGIAKALGLPFLETKMSGLQQDGTFPINSEIARFLGNNESKNAVIFIDEAGDLFHSLRDNNPLNSLTLSELKKLLDPDNLKIEDRTIPKTQAMHQSTQRIFQDLSKVTFILTGNYEIEEEALKSRITTLEFPKVSLKDRKKIAQIIWEKNSSGLPLDESTQRVLEEITQKTDEKFDGVREMKTIIQNYIVERSSNPDQPFNVDEELKAFTKKPATELTPSQGSPSPAPSASP
ncbi:MAG: AAA family ATPase [Bdellovibrionia bacterium]